MSDCKHIDTLMMDWLYDELDTADKARFDHHVDGCQRCQGEIDSFARTREAVRVLPEEDPPPALSAILLHEAAKRAPAAGRRTPAVWTWFLGVFQPIMAHPAAAAVATLVLVVGVAGSLFMRSAGVETASPAAAPHDSSRSENELARTRAADATLEEPPVVPGDGEYAPPRPAEGYAVDALDEQQKQSYGVVANTEEPRLKTLDEDVGLAKRKVAPLRAELGRDSATDDDEESNRRRAPARRAAKPRRPMANAVSSADGLLDERELDAFVPGVATEETGATVRGKRTVSRRDTAAGKESPAGGVAGGPLVATGTGLKAGPVPAQSVRKPSPAPVAEAPAGLNQAPSSDKADSKMAEEKTRASSNEAWARATEQRMLKAVKAKDCRTAAGLAADIFDRNRGYYYKNIQNARSFKSCQAAFDNEQRQRARRRNRSKANSAPDFDEEMPAETTTN